MSDNFTDDWVEGPEEAWLFSWGYGQEHPNRYVRIEGAYFEARAEMVRRYGRRWAFQYPESEELQLQACDMWPLPDDELRRELQADMETTEGWM